MPLVLIPWVARMTALRIAPVDVVARLAPAGVSDLASVVALFGLLHGFNAALDSRFALAENWRDLLCEHFTRTQASPAALWLLAWQGERPVGLLVMKAHQDSPLFRHRGWAEVVALYVDEGCWGSGLGRRLMTEAQQWAIARGFDRVQLYVTAANERARSFYSACGLRPVQEVWRLDVQPRPGVVQPADPSCVTPGCGVELLEPGHHHLAMDGDTGRGRQP